MTKTKNKMKGVLKFVAAGFAFMMCGAFFPAAQIAGAVNYNTKADAQDSTTRIEIGEEGKQNGSITVNRGDSVEIPVANYVKEGTSYIIGSSSAITSTVKVFYKATGDEVELDGNSFVASRVGAYTIVYEVIETDENGNKVPYTYELQVNSQATSASFDFKANEDNVVPSVYDPSIANSRNIVLPLPSVKDEDGNIEIDATAEGASAYFTNTDTYTGPTDKKVYVKLSIEGGSDSITIKPSADKSYFYISGEDLSAKNQADEYLMAGKSFKVYYSFYQINTNGDVFVASTSQEFKVEANHYFKDADKTQSGYEVETTWSTKVPDSAVVGVEKTLPKLTATTKAANSPASEEVAISYDVKVFKMDNEGSYSDDVTTDVITKDGNFKAKEEGSYKFVYTVSDFYEMADQTDLSATTFTIDNVKDTVSAKAHIYDASNKNAFDGTTYLSAKNLMKTKSINRNIIVYAIGGTDNMVAQSDITLRREIRRDSSSSLAQYKIDEQLYNDYNLIFAPSAEAGSSKSVYEQIVVDNYSIYAQMINAEKAPNNEAQIKQFLIDNNYLLVITDIDEAKALVDNYDPTNKDMVEDLRDLGYAYVAPTNSNSTFTKEDTYTIYYYANDNKNSNGESSVSHNITVASSITDASIPTLTFSSALQAAYLPTEKFSFSVATAADTADENIEAVTAYRFVDENKKPLTSEENDESRTTLDYVVMNAKDTTKWYSTAGRVQSKGWYTTDGSTLTVDLAKRPEGAAYVEILAYAIDDYGNVGFFTKTIQIAESTDVDIPEIYKVVGAPDSTTTYSAPQEIALPTLYFADAKSNYIHAEVAVYKLTVNEDKTVDKTPMQSFNMKTNYDTQREYFKVDAGMFKASTKGLYQVAITVSDSGNHSVTTYFTYDVKGGVVTEEPTINNISAETVEIDPGKAHYLTPPTVSVNENETFGYIGIDAGDDANTATYYTTSVISSTNNNYELDQFYFVGNSYGTYKVQYNVFLLQYRKDGVTSVATANKLYFDANGKLKFVDSDSNEYFVYIDQEDGYKVKAAKTLQGENELVDIEELETLNALVEGYNIPSEVQTIKVTDVVMSVSIDDTNYRKNTFEEVGGVVKIVKPDIDFLGKGDHINKAESKVTITKTIGSTTYTLATINIEDWELALSSGTNSDFQVNGENISLVMKDNGKYTIKYSIQAQDYLSQNVGEVKELTYTFASGDTEAPTLTIKNDLTEARYSKGETLVLNLTAIEMSDKVTTNKEDLLSEMVIKIKNADLNEGYVEIEKNSDGDYTYLLENEGEYTILIQVTDGAGLSTSKTYTFKVGEDETSATDANSILGGVMIGVAVALLAGVVIYFTASKIKLDRKEKKYKRPDSSKK